MTRIKDLPSSDNFRVVTGASNFTKKFTKATKFGELANLHDNRKTILKVLRKNEAVIRRGSFNRLRQLSAWNSVKKMEGAKLTKDDSREIKQLFKYLGGAKEAEVVEKKINMDKALDKDVSFKFERNKELKARMLGKVSRFDREHSGGESRIQFTSHPEGLDEETISMSGALLSRRFNPKGDRLKIGGSILQTAGRKKLEKRLEIADIEKDLASKMSKKPGDKAKAEPEKKRGTNAFRLTDV